jgi:hypothetical protein
MIIMYIASERCIKVGDLGPGKREAKRQVTVIAKKKEI